MPSCLPHRQRGAVLIVSLIILIMMTIIGVTALSTATLEQRMAVNTQQDDMMFQAAESEIENVIDTATTTITGYSTATDPMVLVINNFGTNNPMALTAANIPDATTAAKLNPTFAGSPNVSATATIEYTGKMASSATCGNGFQFGSVVCYQFTITSTATIANSNASQVHIQGVQRLGPAGS